MFDEERGREDHLEERILRELEKETRLLEEIVHRATHIVIEFTDPQGAAIVSLTIEVGQSVIATPVEKDASGNVVAISSPSSITWISSDSTIATGRAVGDGTGSFTGIAAGEVTVTVTDPSNGLTATDTLTVTAPPPPPPPPDVATSIAIEWGTPTTAEPTT